MTGQNHSQNKAQRQEPLNYSQYERTGNIAIDLVAQAVGYNKLAGRKLETIYLAHAKWLLFVEGMRVLHGFKGKQMDNASEFTFENVIVTEGSRMQIEPIRMTYVNLQNN